MHGELSQACEPTRKRSCAVRKLHVIADECPEPVGCFITGLAHVDELDEGPLPIGKRLDFTRGGGAQFEGIDISAAPQETRSDNGEHWRGGLTKRKPSHDEFSFERLAQQGSHPSGYASFHFVSIRNCSGSRT